MPKSIKTIEPEKNICYLRVLSRDNDLNLNVRIEIIRSGWNRNRWNYQNVAEHYKTFLGTPVLCAFPHGQIGDGHNMEERILPNGEEYYDFTGPNSERIVGAVSDNETDIWTEERDGETWVCANAKLWRFYNRRLVDHLAEQGGMEVSAETEIFEEYEEKDKGTVFTSWRGLGVTILNEKVAPAVPGANIKALKAISGEKWNSIKLAAASYHPNSGSEPPTNSKTGSDTPEKTEKGVKRNMNLLNKKQLAELNKRFVGYVLLAAAQDENGVLKIKMRNDAFDFFQYEMNAKDETVAPERIARLNASIDMGDGINFAADELFDALNAENVRLNAEKEKAETELGEAKKTITAMQEAESKRRLSAAKEAADSTLRAFNENRTDKVDEAAISGIKADIDKGVYASCADESGEWNGCKAVEDAVYAVCGRKVAENAAKEAKHKFTWTGGDVKNNSGSPATISDLFN